MNVAMINDIGGQWQYLLLMAACIAITLPLEPIFRTRVYRRPLRLIQALLVTAIVFSIWDIIAIHFDLWTYSERYTVGFLLPFGLPLEELVFFLVIPICGVLTYEAVNNSLIWLRQRFGTPEAATSTTQPPASSKDEGQA